MELLEIITGRRSIRRYREQAVPRELLEELLEAACAVARQLAEEA